MLNVAPTTVGEYRPPARLLLGPGPSMVHPRVLAAMAAPLVGHLDPVFLALMNDIQSQLRDVFHTSNAFTIAISGTGSAGMEAALVNCVEPGDRVVVGLNGVFGSRIAAIVKRCGASVIAIERPWGTAIEPEAVEAALTSSAPVKAVALVHAETSTGVLQPLDGLGALCRRHDALLIVDAVTSLGGHEVDVDGWHIDVCYSGTQKCLSCPPGLAPLTVSPRALDAIRSRRSACPSWYFDLSLIAEYWAEAKRAYHHTAPISMLYGLREALRLVLDEGLAERYARHRANSDALLAGLHALGLTPLPAATHRLASLNCVTLPSAVDDRLVRSTLLEEYGIEIGGGLGALQGRVWRIGLMGESSRRAHVYALLDALEAIFVRQGWITTRGDALASAAAVYESRRAVEDT